MYIIQKTALRVAVVCVQTSANGGHNEDLITLISFHLLTTFLLKLFGLIQLLFWTRAIIKQVLSFFQANLFNPIVYLIKTPNTLNSHFLTPKPHLFISLFTQWEFLSAVTRPVSW